MGSHAATQGKGLQNCRNIQRRVRGHIGSSGSGFKIRAVWEGRGSAMLPVVRGGAASAPLRTSLFQKDRTSHKHVLNLARLGKEGGQDCVF